jgi:hypothetical protein
MKLPNGDQAIVDIRKLLDYCLNSQHPLRAEQGPRFRLGRNPGIRRRRIEGGDSLGGPRR